MKRRHRLLDINKLREPAYSHAQALAVAGITADQLQTWYKRGVVADCRAGRRKRRGIRRKYSVFDLMHLAALNELAAAGIPLVVAAVTAASMVQMMYAAWEAIRLGMTEGILFAAYWKGGELQYEVFCRGCPLPNGGIQAWMAGKGITRVHLIDVTGLASQFRARLAEIEATNGKS
jgi:hypothetical protein